MNLYFILKNQSFYIKILLSEKTKESNNLKDLFCFKVIFLNFLT